MVHAKGKCDHFFYQWSMPKVNVIIFFTNTLDTGNKDVE